MRRRNLEDELKRQRKRALQFKRQRMHAIGKGSGGGSTVVEDDGGGGDTVGDDDMTLISSGTISSPINSLDVALPTGFDVFRLTIAGLTKSLPDDNVAFAAVFSKDAGATFYNDPDDALAYDGYTSALGNTSFLVGSAGKNSIMNLGAHDPKGYIDGEGVPTVIGYDLEILIVPGNGTIPPSISGHGRAVSGAHPFPFVLGWVLVAGAGFADRMNLIRIAKRGNGDLSAIGVGADGTLTGGSWFLRGEATP